MERSVLHAYLLFLVLPYALPVLVCCPISSFSIFFVDNELASRARPRSRQRQRLRLHLRPVIRCLVKKTRTQKRCVFRLCCSPCRVMWVCSCLHLGVYVVCFPFPYLLWRCVVLSWFVLFIWIFRERVAGEISATRISAKGNERFVHSHYISLLLCVCLGIWPPHLCLWVVQRCWWLLLLS
jgi:hypothetical protein